MSIITNRDFVGEYSISQSCYDELDKYITKYEKKYLVDLLGADLYALFIADLDLATPQVPTTQRFLDIYNSFDIDNNSCVRSSDGLKTMVIQFIYFHYMRDANYAKTSSGVMRTVSEVSSILPYDGFNLIDSFNQGVKNYLEIQWFICDNSSVYPEENSQPKCFSSGI